MRRFLPGQISIRLLAIALLGACTQDPAPAADPVEAPEADPAPEADEPTDAPPQAEAPPAPEVGLHVVDPGKKPQPMRMTATVGTTARLIVTVRVNTRRGEGPAPLSPRARFVVDTKVTSASETGFRRELEITE